MNTLPTLPEPAARETYATASNTDSVRQGYEMGGYVKSPDLYTAAQMREYAAAALAAAVAAERERCAELMERQHTWISSVSASRLIRGNTRAPMTGYVDEAAAVAEPVSLETVYETIIHWDEGGGKRSRRELARRIVDIYAVPPQHEPVEWLTGCPECGMDGGCDCPSGTDNTPQREPLTRRKIQDLMTQHYPLDSLLRENVDAFEACVRDIERAAAQHRRSSHEDQDQ